MIDLRSDTVTRPDEGMRRAMYEAEVGDDVFGEDPTVRELEAEVAALTGKEASLFVPSGTMGNQIGIYLHTSPGDEILVERSSHIFNYESGAGPALSGVQITPIDGVGALMSPDQVDEAVRPGYYWESRVRLLCLENTINKAGGIVVPIERTAALAAAARAKGLALHLDGARIWNASVATGTTESELAAPFDTVSVCLSKGLGAPVGSLICGTSDLIDRAHRRRKQLGGGMRQIGILAAAGLYAIRNNKPRLQEDHANAQLLAEGLQNMGTVSVNLERVHTNIVMFDVAPGKAVEFLGATRKEGVQMVPFGPSTVRATTHLDVDANDIRSALDIIAAVSSRKEFRI
ncbi:MAG: low specificity L-threonine aldolase [Bacteroidetes bacterium]|nr:low specificity L-threonine aldolase [Bacteroidota bacterium]